MTCQLTTQVWSLGAALAPGPCAHLNTGRSITSFRLSQIPGSSLIYTALKAHFSLHRDPEAGLDQPSTAPAEENGGSWWGSPAAENSQEQIWGVLQALLWLQGSHTLKDIITGIKPQHIKPGHDFTGSCTMAQLATRQGIICCPEEAWAVVEQEHAPAW